MISFSGTKKNNNNVSNKEFVTAVCNYINFYNNMYIYYIFIIKYV